MVNTELKGLDTPRFTVTVTQEDIDTSIPKSSGHCMIADAVKRDFKKKFKRNPRAVSADIQTVRLTDPKEGLRYIYLLPQDGQVELTAFDRGIKPLPFKFRLKGGQVVAIKNWKPKARTEKDKESIRQGGKKYRAIIKLKKARVRVGSDYGSSAPVLTKVGGVVPGEAILSGRRREFGARLSDKAIARLQSRLQTQPSGGASTAPP